MQANIETPKLNGKSNGQVLVTEKSRSEKINYHSNGHISIFDPNKYMLKLPKTKKVSLPNGQVSGRKRKLIISQLPQELPGFGKTIRCGASSQR